MPEHRVEDWRPDADDHDEAPGRERVVRSVVGQVLERRRTDQRARLARGVSPWQGRLDANLREWVAQMEMWSEVVGELGRRGLPLLTPDELDRMVREMTR